ncbi:MAG: SCO family protein [Anaerolineae bacterium]|nr:SCO family protein [Anaerolineae bacterium]
MRVFKSLSGRGFWLRYTALIVLLVGLFLVGLKLGNLAFAMPPQANLAPGVGDKPLGGAVVNPPLPVHDVTLTNQSGTAMSLKELRGRAVVLFFGYTHCPDICPNTLAIFTQVKSRLGAEADRAAFVLVTVDSKRDTPPVLKAFLSHFDSGFIGLTGDESTLHQVAAEYGAYFSLPADQHMEDGDHHEDSIDSDNYFVQHTSPAYLIDPKGFLRVVYFNGTSSEVIANGIRQILQETN